MKKSFLLILFLGLFTFSFGEVSNSKKEEINNKSLSENEKKELIKEPVKKYKKEKKSLNNIEVSGTATFRYDSRK